MPAGPRLVATEAMLRVCFFLRRKAAEEKKGLGRNRTIVEPAANGEEVAILHSSRTQSAAAD